MERTFKRGEVYYIDSFPTTGHEQRSGRPAVIVSNNENNTHSEVVEICYFTLKDKTPLPTHVYVNKGPCTGSTILCEQITSVSIERIGDYMCRVSEEIEEALDKALTISLALKCKESTYTSPFKNVGDEIEALKTKNAWLTEQLNEAKQALASSTMYEKLYNDLLNKLIERA